MSSPNPQTHAATVKNRTGLQAGKQSGRHAAHACRQRHHRQTKTSKKARVAQCRCRRLKGRRHKTARNEKRDGLSATRQSLKHAKCHISQFSVLLPTHAYILHKSPKTESRHNMKKLPQAWKAAVQQGKHMPLVGSGRSSEDDLLLRGRRLGDRGTGRVSLHAT